MALIAILSTAEDIGIREWEFADISRQLQKVKSGLSGYRYSQHKYDEFAVIGNFSNSEACYESLAEFCLIIVMKYCALSTY